MKLIAGLGNPGLSYFNSRHNIGFEVVDKLCQIYNIELLPKHKALMGTGLIDNTKIILAKPQTYMNLSGESIRQIADYYKISNSDITIIHDDLDVPIGKIKIKHNGSSGGHNGVKNIILHLGGENFNRIRIGIGKKPQGWLLDDYVLGKFPPDEKKDIDIAVDKACDSVKIIVKDVFTAMNKFNVREGNKNE